ncbi:MAG: glycosyltransferase family 4 protein [Oscillospiraceae bacterium]|nr:glycosyltransferase family 4 protein [Oscillospiraceae bacterium]
MIKSKISLNAFLNADGVIEKSLIEFFYESGSDIDYFSPLIEEIQAVMLSHDEKTAEQIENKALYVINNSKLSAQSKILLLRVLFKAKCFSPALMKCLVRLLGEIKDNVCLKYWLLFDLSFMWIYHHNILYDEFWQEKKQLNEDYARELNLSWNPPVYDCSDNNRICVLVNVLDIRGTNLYISPIVRAVKNQGYNVDIICLSPKRYDSSMSFMKPFFAVNNQGIIPREELLNLYPEDIKLHYTFNDTMKNRQQDALDLICKINPYCILDFTDEQAPVSYYYSKSYPTIYFPIRKQGCSSSFFHKCVVWESGDSVQISPPAKEEQVIRLPLFKEYVKPFKKFIRTDYSIATDDVVVVSVGGRLVFETSNELLKSMCELLCYNNSIKWLIVGCSSFPYIECNYPDLITNRNIVLIDYETDLPGFFSICDIYLNPSRIGGGTTVAWAMQQGLAIVSPLNSSDATVHIGKRNAHANESDLVPYIEKLSSCNSLLTREKEKYRTIAEEWDINKFTDTFIPEMRDLAISFNT